MADRWLYGLVGRRLRLRASNMPQWAAQLNGSSTCLIGHNSPNQKHTFRASSVIIIESGRQFVLFIFVLSGARWCSQIIK